MYYFEHGDRKNHDDYKRQNIEWLKKQIEALDESGICDNDLKKLLYKELNRFLTKLVIN